MGLGISQSWIHMSGPLLTRCVALAKLLHSLETQLPHLENGTMMPPSKWGVFVMI